MSELTGRDLDAAVAVALGWIGVGKRRVVDAVGDHEEWRGLRNNTDTLHEIPHYSRRIEDAWEIVTFLRDTWTAATASSSGIGDDFIHPFDDGGFFEMLHRHADRRWPWAFLYVTPEAICRAFLAAVR